MNIPIPESYVPRCESTESSILNKQVPKNTSRAPRTRTPSSESTDRRRRKKTKTRSRRNAIRNATSVPVRNQGNDVRFK